jgi:hypothetical protein
LRILGQPCGFYLQVLGAAGGGTRVLAVAPSFEAADILAKRLVQAAVATGRYAITRRSQSKRAHRYYRLELFLSAFVLRSALNDLTARG